MAEFRLGIFKSQTRGLEKNDDKLEFQSRVGYAASKNWYYSVRPTSGPKLQRGTNILTRTILFQRLWHRHT